MLHTRPFMALVVLTLLAAGCATPVSSPGVKPESELDLSDFRANGASRRQIVVKYAGTPPSMGLKIKRIIPSLQTMVVEVPAGSTPEDTMRQLEQAPGTAYVDYVRKVDMPLSPGEPERQVQWVPHDPKIDRQYWLNATNALRAWDVTKGEKRTVIAIVDGGIDIEHPDLKKQVVAAYNVTTRSNRLQANEHATHCAGIALAEANSSEGIAGMAPGCGLMSVQICDDSGRSTDPLIAEGIVWAVDHGAKVVSMSFGEYERSKVLEDAIQYALSKDVVLVAAAGNDNLEIGLTKEPAIPACFPGVIKVAATDAQNRKAKFSNWGDITLAAPGVDIYSTVPGVFGALRYQKMSGTSMAAPGVAGVAGLVRFRYPHLTQQQVKRHLERTAQDLGEPGVDRYFGHGLIDAAAAVSSKPID